MNLNIFIPAISDQTVVDDSILPLLQEAIAEGLFVYPYHISNAIIDLLSR